MSVQRTNKYIIIPPPISVGKNKIMTIPHHITARNSQNSHLSPSNECREQQNMSLVPLISTKITTENFIFSHYISVRNNPKID